MDSGQYWAEPVARATRLVKWTGMILLLSWVVFPWLGIVYPPFPFESRGAVLGMMTVWLLLALALGCILSFWLDHLTASGLAFWGSPDYRSGGTRRGEKWPGHDGGSRR